MTPGFNSANGIPGNGVVLALANGLAAVRANPGLIVLSIVTRGGLHRILHPALKLGSFHSDSDPL